MNESAELATYLAAFRMHPVLSDEEEFLRLFRLYKSGRKAAKRARDRIICGNIRLVVPIAIGMAGRGLPLLDMIQEGVFGLEKALEKFDPSRGNRYSTYASWWVRSSISRAIYDSGFSRPLRLPVWVHEEMKFVRKASRQYFLDYRAWPTAEEVLEIVHRYESPRAQNMKLETAADLLLLNIQKGVSLNAKAPSRKNDHGDKYTLGESISDPDVDIESHVELLKVKERLEEILTRLTPREAIIIRARFGFNGKGDKTLVEVGNLVGLTRERIRQIEAKALQKIKVLLGHVTEEYAQLP